MSFNNLILQIKEAFDIDRLEYLKVFKNRDKSHPIIGVERTLVSDHGLKHGDMLFVDIQTDIIPSSASSSTSSNDAMSTGGTSTTDKFENGFDGALLFGSANGTATSPVEDEVDIKLWSQSGLIERPPDEKLCRHGPKAKCLHCTPIEPYDENYLKEQKIKHMSFHSYLRKMTRGVDKGKFAFLEDISCRIKPGCREHAPWPQGICTKCQPNAVTLNRQEYRHVDNIVFENPSIVERFLDYWRKTGHQRLGFLYGKYDTHADVPLGIKATIVSIYEPPQDSTTDMVKLLPDSKLEAIDFVASNIGLRRIGWIFTDLVPLDRSKGTVKYVRGADSHFLSAQEVIMAGVMQNCHPNPCRLSPSGFFGSKAVTVCVTGNSENQIHMEGYQVSNQCMALVRDSCLLPTRDAPELGYIRETSREQFVPDVFFKEKDEFANDVTKIARPLPIEYLLVDVPTSTPVEPRRTFNPIASMTPFPITNRFIEGQTQDLHCLESYLSQFTEDQILEALSDFHLLIFLATHESLVSSKQELAPLLVALRRKDKNLVSTWISKNDYWSSLQNLLSSNHSGNFPQT